MTLSAVLPPAPATRRRRPEALLALLLPLLLGVPALARASWGTAAARAGPPPIPILLYELRPAADLGTVEVEARFQGWRPLELRLPLPEAHEAVEAAPAAPGRFGAARWGGGFSLTLAGGRDPSAERLLYRVDLRALGAGRRGPVRRVGRDLLLHPGALLLVPAAPPAGLRLAVTWRLPEGLSASVPWPREPDGRHLLPPLSLEGDARLALGRFSVRALEAAGSRLEVVLLDGPRAATDAGVDAWLGAAFRAGASLFGGRFPAPSVQVLIEPVGRSSEPVPFGEARLAGGASLHALLAAQALDDDLPGEWVAIHEALHLTMPWIDPADLWFSEGFVTYYQELLRARAGHLTEQALFESLVAGFARGAAGGTGRTLAEESRELPRSHAFMRVYWGGAALALAADLALRRATGGRRSLDDLMRLWSGPGFAGRKGLRGLHLLRRGEEATGVGGLAAEAERALASPGFPDTSVALGSLGVRTVEGRVLLSPQPPAADARRALLRAPPGPPGLPPK